MLAEKAEISVATLQRAEGSAAMGAAADSVRAIVGALEKGGVVFIARNGGGPGVRLKK